MACKCDSCKQSSCEYERAKLPEVHELVHWAKYDKDKDGQRTIPSGRECSSCQAKRRLGLNNIPQDELNELRSKVPELDEIFTTGRDEIARNRGSGRRNSHEKIDMAKWKTKQTSSTFTERTQDYEFIEMEASCKEHAPRGMKFKNNAERKTWVQAMLANKDQGRPNKFQP